MELKLAPRAVRIDSIELTSWQWPVARLVVHCGKGTYIRSLARDLGEAMGTGGYISQLRRLAVGPFTVDKAIARDDWEQDKLRAALLGREAAVAALPRIVLQVADADTLCQGRPQPSAEPLPERVDHAIFDTTGRLRAVGHFSDGYIRPTKVFHAHDSVSPRPEPAE
jgi:tRNA pseudouridine55 synthase